MKIVCQCDYCGMRDTQDKIEVHESTCVRNTALRACYTCKNKKGLCLTKFECKKDVQIPEGKYMMNCPQWELEEEPYDIIKVGPNHQAKEDNHTYKLRTFHKLVTRLTTGHNLVKQE